MPTECITVQFGLSFMPVHWCVVLNKIFEQKKIGEDAAAN